MFNWRSLTPVFVPALSSASLVQQDELFNIGDGTMYRNAPLAPHWHDCYELGFISDGHGFMVFGDEEYPYEAGQVYIVNDMEPHMTYAHSEITSLFVVHFPAALLDDNWITKMRSEAHIPFVSNFGAISPLVPLDDPVGDRVRAILEAIRSEAYARDNAWEVIVGALVLQAVGHLARRLLEQPEALLRDHQRREALQRIRPVLYLIENEYKEALSLDDMAAAACVSRSHCCALFRTALNTTPIAYRNARRLTEAQRLLQSSDQTVREIAYHIGFSSVQEFNRLFLRRTGMTPTNYRQRFYSELQKIRS